MWCWCQAISAVIKLGEEFYFAFPPSATQYSSRNPSWCVLSKPVDIASSQTSGPQRDVGSTAVQDALVQGWMTFVSTPLCGEVIKSGHQHMGLMDSLPANPSFRILLSFYLFRRDRGQSRTPIPLTHSQFHKWPGLATWKPRTQPRFPTRVSGTQLLELLPIIPRVDLSLESGTDTRTRM